jgi:hypothetical protein
VARIMGNQRKSPYEISQLGCDVPKRFLPCDVTVLDAVGTRCLRRDGNAWIQTRRELIKMGKAFGSEFGDAASEACDRHNSVAFRIKAGRFHIDHNRLVEAGEAVVAIGGQQRQSSPPISSTRLPLRWVHRRD